MKILKKAGTIGAIAAFLRSPAGQQLIEKGKAVASDPRTRAKVQEVAKKLTSGRSRGGTGRTY